ncbi:hypothetical protein GSN00_13990 [Cylindrospermopsis raciborskii CHAB3438]|uniref:hypothetical protein n=1 Tax=Cylindrospermopsis TaxID=77021 RepID=UPI00070F24D1|nr:MULTISPECIES: hypothetical protein [Cylindrospermopsis]KRH95454.1 hypothetical protein ASL19_11340 [Cylindrospermopsis sp. CR12]MCH4905451.1 hypothetical protein [Cylindrospermopsis raciborskii CHAB3438]MEB3147284.1 hypothetical protein [Cylindrospermopsis raciborskii]
MKYRLKYYFYLTLTLSSILLLFPHVRAADNWVEYFDLKQGISTLSSKIINSNTPAPEPLPTKVDPKPNNNGKELAEIKSRLDEMEKVIIMVAVLCCGGIFICLFVLFQLIENPSLIKDFDIIYRYHKSSVIRLDALENQLDVVLIKQKTLIDIISNLTNSDKSDGEQVPPIPQQIPQEIPQPYQTPKLGPNIFDNPIVALYNGKVKLLANMVIRASEVKLTARERRSGRYTRPVLEENRQGNYWIINQRNMIYLVPKFNMRITSRNYDAISVFFECIKYDPNSRKSFKLINPAIVFLKGSKWELFQRGELEF